MDIDAKTAVNVAIILLVIYLISLISLIKFSGFAPQTMQITFLSVLALGFFYENQKGFLLNLYDNHDTIKKIIPHLGNMFIFFAIISLLLLIPYIVFVDGIITNTQLFSILISVALSFGLFLANMVFKKFNEKIAKS